MYDFFWSDAEAIRIKEEKEALNTGVSDVLKFGTSNPMNERLTKKEIDLNKKLAQKAAFKKQQDR